jgi:hypothetical protein
MALQQRTQRIWGATLRISTLKKQCVFFSGSSAFTFPALFCECFQVQLYYSPPCRHPVRRTLSPDQCAKLKTHQGARDWVGTKSKSGRNHVWNRVPATMDVLVSYGLRLRKGSFLAKDAEHKTENINFSAQFHYN